MSNMFKIREFTLVHAYCSKINGFLKTRTKIFTALSLLFLFGAFALNSHAATLQVDDNAVECPAAAHSTIQSAVTAAAPGDTIQVCSGTYPLASLVTLNKTGLIVVGFGATRPIVQIPASTGNGFQITAANITLDNFEIQKTDLLGVPHELIFVQGNNFTAQNNLIYGPDPGSPWSVNGLVSRAFVVTGGLSGLLLTNNTIHTLRQPAYINGPTTGTISNNNVSGTRGWVIDGATIIFTNNTFGPPANQGADIALLASCNPADYPNLPALSANNDNAVISAQFVGGVSGSSTTYVNAGAGPGGIGTIDAPFQTITQGIGGVYAGGTVNVAAGNYNEDVVINKAGVIVSGAGSATTIVSGPIGGGGSTFSITESNVELRNFQITRDGNNTTDWNNPGLNSAGISIQGLTIIGVLIHDNLITGMRTAIDVNNSNGHTVRNNVIDNNRTGLIFRNQTDNMTVVENAITNNWTVGILFLDASLGTNVPVQTALNSGFGNNNLSGNWYGQIVDRQSGGALPAPGTTNLKNFRGNWYGTITPVVSVANSAEPGYAALIPVIFGGAAVPPGGQPDILGPSSANFLFNPLLTSGTDTNVETTPGRGTFGFQGAPIPITAGNPGGWAFLNETPSGTGTYVAGPGTPPLGIGSARLTVNNTGGHIIGKLDYPGTRLNQITQLVYSTYQNNNTNPAPAIAFQFNLDEDLTDGNTAFQGRLVYEPINDTGQPVIQGVWQTWNVLSATAKFWASPNANSTIDTTCPQASPCTLAQVLTAFPNLGIHASPTLGAVLFKVGGGIGSPFDGNVDAFTIGINNAQTTFDFEPTMPTVTVNQAIGQVDPTSTSPINFTVTFNEPVSGFDAADVTLGGTAGPTTKVVTGGPTVYNVAVGGMAGSGIVTATIPAGGAIAVSSGAPNAASTSTDNAVTYFTCNNVSVPTGLTAVKNTQIAAPINVDSTTGRGILSFDFTYTYDPAVAIFLGTDQAGTLSSGFTVSTNSPTPGTVVVSGFGTDPLAGSGQLLKLNFFAIGGISTTTNLNLTAFKFNEGIPCVTTTNGNLTVISGTVSGMVTYANSVVVKPVVRTNLNGTGSLPAVSTMSDLSGLYSLSGFGPGAYTVTPTKTGDVNGITAFDSGLIAQHVIGLNALNATQQIVADVSANGTVTSFDAALIAQYAVLIPNPGNTGTWKFLPVSRAYANVEANQANQDYQALLMGEVSGGWTAPLSFSGLTEDLRKSGEGIGVSIPTDLVVSNSVDFNIPVILEDTTGQGFISYQFDLVYDPEVVQPLENACSTLDTLSGSMTVTCNKVGKNLLTVAVFGAMPLDGKGVGINLKFNAVGKDGMSSSLALRGFMFNEGELRTRTTDGTVKIGSTNEETTFVGGQIQTRKGLGVANARISLIDANGVSRSTTTDEFGNYGFESVPLGESYEVRISADGYKFPVRHLTVATELRQADFVVEQ